MGIDTKIRTDVRYRKPIKGAISTKNSPISSSSGEEAFREIEETNPRIRQQFYEGLNNFIDYVNSDEYANNNFKWDFDPSEYQNLFNYFKTKDLSTIDWRGTSRDQNVHKLGELLAHIAPKYFKTEYNGQKVKPYFGRNFINSLANFRVMRPGDDGYVPYIEGNAVKAFTDNGRQPNHAAYNENGDVITYGYEPNYEARAINGAYPINGYYAYNNTTGEFSKVPVTKGQRSSYYEIPDDNIVYGMFGAPKIVQAYGGYNNPPNGTEAPISNGPMPYAISRNGNVIQGAYDINGYLLGQKGIEHGYNLMDGLTKKQMKEFYNRVKDYDENAPQYVRYDDGGMMPPDQGMGMPPDQGMGGGSPVEQVLAMLSQLPPDQLQQVVQALMQMAQGGGMPQGDPNMGGMPPQGGMPPEGMMAYGGYNRYANGGNIQRTREQRLNYAFGGLINKYRKY